MAGKLKRMLQLYALYARMDFNWLVQDTAGCLLVIASDLIATLASISGVGLLAVRFGGVGGLSTDEMLWMLGFFTVADGFTYMLLGANNILNISRRVGRGQVDHMLIQPCPLWMQLAEGFMPVTGSSGFLAGLALMGYTTARLGVPVTPGWVALLALYLLARVAVTAGGSLLAGSTAFYRPVACEEISSVVLDFFGTLGKFPLFMLPGWLAGLLITAVPVGLMAYFPALALLGKLGHSPVLALPVAVGALFLALGITSFRKGLKRYAKYSCSRYREMGHRR